MKTEYLEAGRIVGTHGVRGELRLEPWCDSASFLRQFHTLYWEKDKNPVQVMSSRVHKNLLLLTLEGVATLEQADALRGKVLCFRRADVNLPEGTYFQQDLLGLTVTDAQSGQVYGTLTQVYSTGANDVYEVKDTDGKTVLLPAVPQVVKKIDLESGTLEILPMEGMFHAD
ncbi:MULTISPECIES: ribosome maturation factor RimM [Caproicibacterium]|uniref:Ribosome maturation factor RimM n=1 Tax=Caproicibacterium lactatifermentans TaxID=2666138 RepID=A0A859DRH6_9FIRM|nr:ribosome maturation factor RimM [Caproicibacterium lactatifermentans]ARP50880.1 16S rRNA processing protein RimM [Ruminococcaceae bacterium CPB6]MDD4807513.1 ribosome maturation factor RimM [Oscillospiraceae bacterium]QKN23392.1 16S rRNA processing protein RimM [Caproicibacterium lactatifermentans]QKO29930.1 16S rRNA processing protein RimM [Caproicibacterium lactatifermentans]